MVNKQSLPNKVTLSKVKEGKIINSTQKKDEMSLAHFFSYLTLNQN